MAIALSANLSMSAVQFDGELIGKLSQQGPRYTSYPTADRFTAGFRVGDYLQAVNEVRALGVRNPLSLYLHIPFCEKLCYYCACNKVVTKHHSKAAEYLTYLKREIDMQGRLFADMNHVEQLHLGGGTPTFLSDEQLRDLMAHLRRWFNFATDEVGEYSIEVDPRTVTSERIHALRATGFNRISFGVQDFDADVQKAVNRIQSEESVLAVIRAAREAAFRSISIDLIYGLPKQTLASMEVTLSKVIAADPDRISIYNYAHMPHIFKPQRRIAESDLPAPNVKLQMLNLCIERLTRAGYVYIGMDHFAKPSDELAIAQQQGRLHRNFQGYSTHAGSEMVSCGLSAISAVGSTYSQNEKTLEAYYERIEQGELPIVRGIKLSLDDLLRRIIIQTLMCNFELSMQSLEVAYPISFKDYFSREMDKLRTMEDMGLLHIDDQWITVTPKGRLVIRNICMVFDHHLTLPRPESNVIPLRFSRTI